MTVKVFKLVDGSEVIAKELENDEVGYKTLDKPRVIQVMPHESGRMSVGLIPWVIAAPDAACQIAVYQIMTTVSISLDVEKMYLQQTSGIDLSSSL